MIGRSLVDELSEDRDKDEKIIKSFYAKDSLSKDIFQETKMIPSVRDSLLSIADKFIDYMGVDFFAHDVVLTGSLANFNWSEFSDIDLHIIIDYEESGHNQGLLKEFFDAKTRSWNLSHDIKIKNYEVELYVQDIKEKHISSGVYSILNKKWMIAPEKEKKYIDDKQILEKGEIYGTLIDMLIEANKKGIDISKYTDEVKRKLKRFRQSGLDKGGEYSYENLTFKLLRRNGYIEKLMNLKKKVTDKQYSINEFEEFINGEEDICESVEFSDRDILRVEKESIKFYGTTDSFIQSGFITPSGYLLDFSEGTGSRVQDHRNIGYVLELLPDIDLGEYGTGKWKNSTSWGMYAILDMGFIRYHPESYGVHIVKMPTQEQFQKLRQLINQRDGKINLQLMNNDYVEYEPGTPEEHIIEGIKSFFREGTKPRQYSDTEDEEMFLDRDVDEDVMSQGKQQMFGVPDDDEEANKKTERYMELEKSKVSEEPPFGYVYRYWNEELVKFPIYKNPKSLNGFDEDVRGIVTKDGDLYVAKNNGPFNHNGMSEVLQLPENTVYNQMEDYPLLNRIGSSNNFGLSDSTAEYIKKERVDIRIVANILRLTKKKNPQYGFYLEYYLNVGPQHRRL